MSTSLSLRLRTYDFASPVIGGGAAGGCLEARSRYQNPAVPATSTRPITAPAGGMANLFSANRHLSDLDGGGGDGAAELQVGADCLQPQQHLFEIGRDGDFGDGERQLAVANPQAGRALGIVSGDAIHSEPLHLRNIKPV